MSELARENGEATLEQPIDRLIFLPLSRYLNVANFDAEDIQDAILHKVRVAKSYSYFGQLNKGFDNKGFLIQFRGFILEAYVSEVLSRFAEENPTFSKPKLSFPVEILGFQLIRNSLGSIAIKRNDSDFAEFDSLYEFVERDLITPIVFEIGYLYGAKWKTDIKMGLVRQIYGVSPYLCEVVIRAGTVGLQRVEREETRIINIPNGILIDSVAQDVLRKL